MSHHRPAIEQRPIPKSAGSAPIVDLNAEVARLIGSQKMKQAVELAKEQHKRLNSAESEKLLVDAYIARIGQFQEKGQAEDARTLIKLVKERFPAHASRLETINVKAVAAGGMVDELISPLAQTDLPNPRREAIETAIRQQFVDLHALAESRALPDEHPLKVAAAALWRAFDAVTAGPVSDEQIALPEVSRRSPLAGWRMLIRAIAALHRNDDDGCRRALDAIAPDAAVARLAPLILNLMAVAPDPARGATGALQARIAAADGQIRTAVTKVESSFHGRYVELLVEAVFEAYRVCDAQDPKLGEQLRRRIASRCAAMDVPEKALRQCIASIRPDANFWRAMAVGYEACEANELASQHWERFLRHAVAEGMFPENSLEAGMVYARMARLISESSRNSNSKYHHADVTHGLYRNQPSQIAALAPSKRPDAYAWTLDAASLFQRATLILPEASLYKQWLDWAQSNGQPPKLQEDIALAWQQALPRDPEPAIRLSIFAEERNALQMAAKRLAHAEEIDPFNPAVRKARVRLNLSILWRHMKDAKAHLVQKDIAELEKLPGFGDGDRLAFVLVVKAVAHVLENKLDAARAAAELAVEKYGVLFCDVLLKTVGGMGRVNFGNLLPAIPAESKAKTLVIAEIDARLKRLAADLRLTPLRPREWDHALKTVLNENPCPLSLADIKVLGNSALADQLMEIAYAASSAGLQKTRGPASAMFLLLRARAVSAWSKRRTAQCLAAALDLARQINDAALMDELSREMAVPRGLRRSANIGKPLDADTLASIIKAERDAASVPKSPAVAEKSVVYFEKEPARRGGIFDLFGDGEDDDGFGFFDDEDDEDDEEGEPDYSDRPKLSAHVLAVLGKVIMKYGNVPSPAELERIDPKLAAELTAAFKK